MYGEVSGSKLDCYRRYVYICEPESSMLKPNKLPFATIAARAHFENALIIRTRPL